MRLGILETGRVNATLAEMYGPYPDMFEKMYQAVDPAVTSVTVPVIEGVLPDSPHDCDVWLVTGSKHGVYDPLPWIEPLKQFLRDARAAKVPLIGICFGHQIMAEAFGGRAVKSEKGWGVGVHDYAIAARPGWMTTTADGFTMHAMHQDQVTALPADATCLASSDFCEYAMVAYGDAESPDAISVQPHPEFETGYARDLVDLRSGVAVPTDRTEAARETFGRPVDNHAFAVWSLAYAKRALVRRAAA